MSRAPRENNEKCKTAKGTATQGVGSRLWPCLCHALREGCVIAPLSTRFPLRFIDFLYGFTHGGETHADHIKLYKFQFQYFTPDVHVHHNILFTANVHHSGLIVEPYFSASRKALFSHKIFELNVAPHSTTLASQHRRLPSSLAHTLESHSPPSCLGIPRSLKAENAKISG